MGALSVRTVLIAMVLAMLAGCAGTARRSTAPLPSTLQQLDRWQAHGRIAVASPTGSGSGSFDWQQRDDRAQVQIRGPIGIGSVNLQVAGDVDHPQLKLETAGGQTLESAAAWDELQSRFGAPLPAGNLRFWMLGLAAPGAHQWHEQNSDGITRLEQDGWQIDYQNYSQEPGLRVPSRMRAKSGAASVRIVIDRWQLGK